MTSALLTKEQVCERLQVSRRSLDRLIAERRIGYRKIGGLVRFSEADLEEFVVGAAVPVVPPSRRRLRLATASSSDSPVRRRVESGEHGAAGAVPVNRSPGKSARDGRSGEQTPTGRSHIETRSGAGTPDLMNNAG